MNTLLVPYQKEICWQRAAQAPMAHLLWSQVTGIEAWGQVAWNEQGLHLRLQAREEKILARFTGDNDMVCRDSCLEFFFCPEANSLRYYNIEVNPNGALYVGFGYEGGRRFRLLNPRLADFLQVRPYRLPGLWGAELTVTEEFVRLLLPEFSFVPGQQLRANFYKCGDDTPTPHYFAWNPVANPTPNFHLPAHFGMLRLGKKDA